VFWFVSAVGLETGSGRSGLFSHRAGPVFLCSVPGRAEPFSGRAGLDIFRQCGALLCTILYSCL